jgi:hypothetical protein
MGCIYNLALAGFGVNTTSKRVQFVHSEHSLESSISDPYRTSKAASLEGGVFDGLVVFNLARIRKVDDVFVRVFFGFAGRVWEDWI